jgi:hypothetical protein
MAVMLQNWRRETIKRVCLIRLARLGLALRQPHEDIPTAPTECRRHGCPEKFSLPFRKAKKQLF